jgi:hypothetical protein
MQKRSSRESRASHAPKRNLPLADGILPLKKDCRYYWAAMSNAELITYGRKFMRENQIETKYGLKKANPRLYRALIKYGQLEKLDFRECQRDWSRLNNRQLIERAQSMIDSEGILTRKGLGKRDAGLLQALRNRKLLGELRFPTDKRRWSLYSDEELISHAQKLVDESGIRNREELRGKDSGLYGALHTRKLLEFVVFEVRKKKRRNWNQMKRSVIVSYAKKVIKSKGIKNRIGLEKEDGGLYNALRKRKLLDRVGLPSSRASKKARRKWAAMSKVELVAAARRIIQERGITSRTELRNKEHGLYAALSRKKLLGKIGLEIRIKKPRNWASMSDIQLIRYSNKIIARRAIKSRSMLATKDTGLYSALLKRGLLDAVFSDMEGLKAKDAVREVVDALAEF